MSLVTPNSLSKTLAANINNEKLSDHQFREFVLKNLSAESKLLNDADFRHFFREMMEHSPEHKTLMGKQIQKLIVIPIDFVALGHVSHMEAREMVESGVSFVVTSSIKALSFDLLKKEYDVLVLYRDGRYLLMSEMLEAPLKYCDKELRTAHNLSKMFIANKLKAQTATDASESALERLKQFTPVKPSRKHSETPTIEITVDFVNDESVSYQEALASVEDMKSFSTANLQFFDFDYLDRGYEVVAKTKDGKSCVLSEFLANSKPHMSKEIRRSHLAWKFLISNGIQYL